MYSMYSNYLILHLWKHKDGSLVDLLMDWSQWVCGFSVAGYTLDDLRDILPKVIAAAAAEQTLENQMRLDTHPFSMPVESEGWTCWYTGTRGWWLLLGGYISRNDHNMFTTFNLSAMILWFIVMNQGCNVYTACTAYQTSSIFARGLQHSVNLWWKTWCWHIWKGYVWLASPLWLEFCQHRS